MSTQYCGIRKIYSEEVKRGDDDTTLRVSVASILDGLHDSLRKECSVPLSRCFNHCLTLYVPPS